MIWLLLAGAIGLETVGTLSLKASQGFTRRGWSALVVVTYLGAFSLLAAVLAIGMPVGVAYGVWSACGVALTALLGRLLFKDALTPTMVAGIVLVMGGVLTIELGTNATA